MLDSMTPIQKISPDRSLNIALMLWPEKYPEVNYPPGRGRGAKPAAKMGCIPKKNNDDPLEMEATDHLFFGGDASFVDNNNQL